MRGREKKDCIPRPAAYLGGMISPSTCRAARALLDWPQRRLAAAAAVSVSAILAYEAGHRAMRPAGLAAIERALREAGVEIIDDGDTPVGVRLQSPRSPAGAL
jgi:transcriptional regulator with XRE-family HTH domain